MRNRIIQGTPFGVSCICLGTAEMGSVMPESEAFAMLDLYAELGGSFLDTALDYGLGASERTIGKWIRSRAERDFMLVATKGGCPANETRHIPRLSREEIETDLHHSLKNLNTERIDLYYLHRDDPARPVEELIDILENLVRAGKIRFYGLSNWKLPRLKQAYAYSGKGGHLVGSEVLWSLAKPDMRAIDDPFIAEMTDDMLCFHQNSGLAAAGYTAQARGFFSKLNNGVPIQDWVSRTYHTQENLARFERAKTLAARRNCSIESIVIAYLTSQPFASFAVISSRNQDQLRLSMQTGDLLLDRAELAFLGNG